MAVEMLINSAEKVALLVDFQILPLSALVQAFDLYVNLLIE